jgi:hypothetical protein
MMVGLDSTRKISEHFKPQESEQNIGIGREMSDSLIAQVKELCYPEYNSLIEVLRDQNMMIE